MCTQVLERRYFDFACGRSVNGDCSANDAYDTEPTSNTANNRRDAAEGRSMNKSVFFQLMNKCRSQIFEGRVLVKQISGDSPDIFGSFASFGVRKYCSRADYGRRCRNRLQCDRRFVLATNNQAILDVITFTGDYHERTRSRISVPLAQGYWLYEKNHLCSFSYIYFPKMSRGADGRFTVETERLATRDKPSDPWWFSVTCRVPCYELVSALQRDGRVEREE